LLSRSWFSLNETISQSAGARLSTDTLHDIGCDLCHRVWHLSLCL
jgi:hypothetical protein